MNIKIFFTSWVLLSAISLLLFGAGLLSQLIDLLRALALSLGGAIFISFIYPHARGVRVGDKLFALISRQYSRGNSAFAFTGAVEAVALQNKRKGEKIKVRLQNGAQAEGIVLDYGGLFSPARVKIIETEMVRKT